MKKFFLTSFLFIVLIGGVTATWVLYGFAFEIVAAPNKTFLIDIPPGSSLSQIRKGLEKNEIHIHPLAWKLWAKFRADPKKLHVGEFEVSAQKSQLEILEEILNAPSKTYALVIKEGHNIFNIRDEGLAALPLPQEVKAEFFSKITNAELAKNQGAPERANPPLTMEGFLFPSTYFFQKYDSAQSIFQKITNEYKKRIEPLLSEHSWGNTPEGRYRLLTLASVVEKESGVFDEQPLIASVFWNRIHKGMRLQSDPTTIYPYFLEAQKNIEQFNLKISHLREPSPYNTYTLKELPVGPIANPGESAVRAVIRPAQSNYFYFVAKGDGTHVFAATLKEHNANVDFYQKKIRPKSTVVRQKSRTSARLKPQFLGLKQQMKPLKKRVLGSSRGPRPQG